MEATINDISNKKNLGQYFSGSPVASLLAHLAQFNKANSIVDPMVGTGDMLWACDPKSNVQKRFFGVEIDQDVWRKCDQRFSANQNVSVIRGNAFDLDIINQLAKHQYDLVITNPPYVRYQTISDNKNNSPENLDTSEIKRNLIASLDYFEHLDTQDKKLFELLISSYSGLSDLAVPSWILCALLTSIGGRIAMVVPQTWLNREYAAVVQYLLFKWFQIESIVEDGHSTWFSDAQVKTTLIVAKRVKRKKSILKWGKKQFSYCTIFSKTRVNGSLIGQLFPGVEFPEGDFLNLIKSKEQQNAFIKVRHVNLANFAQALDFKLDRLKWYHKVEPTKSRAKVNRQTLKVPSHLRDWLGNNNPQFVSLDDIGLNVSQGLRTGANMFFYMSVLDKTQKGVSAIPNSQFPQKQITIPTGCFKEALRKQSELSDSSYTISNKDIQGIALVIREHLSTKDLEECKKSGVYKRFSFKRLPKGLSQHILLAEKINVGTDDEPKFIPKLSAVEPNSKKWNPAKPNDPPRYWYMLPPLTSRHLPDLFVPRVNGKNPITRLNPDSKYVIDANFSTIWLSEGLSEHDIYSALALFNSSWFVVAMEEYGTVMGGGALKLEATQIKKIPIPKLDDITIAKLSNLGKTLVSDPKNNVGTIDRIDAILIKHLGINKSTKSKQAELKSLKHELLKQRTSK